MKWRADGPPRPSPRRRPGPPKLTRTAIFRAAPACAGATALFLLTTCGMVEGRVDHPRGVSHSRSDAVIKIGRPYTVAGRTYVPADDRTYDATGLASWYGAEHAGQPTANGERFDPHGFSAAHTTLPLPSYVEVTVLATGARTIVRINDRGPFRPDRIIDLSEAAARLLGLIGKPPQRVRVRRLEPSPAARAALLAGRPASTAR